MPQHGHGLPTRPRVTRHLGDGMYEMRPLRLKAVELRLLEAFLRTLSGPVDVIEPAPARRSQ
jgi:hypothetical protein